jgi:ATP-dependent Clp protease adapter protein ClpS
MLKKQGWFRGKPQVDIIRFGDIYTIETFVQGILTKIAVFGHYHKKA